VTSSHRVGWFARSSGRLYLRLSGWRVDVLGIRPAWLGKRELFRWPFGRLMRWLGGLPVDRSVPILRAFLDSRRRVGGIAAVIQPTGDLAADMDAIRACDAGITGKFPALDTPIRLLEEDQPAVA
jgi:1-acyl-sn-glycerol-3-phosphate acyltransferase